MATEKKTFNPTREDWLRLAAFIDGEGSILINRKGKTQNRTDLRLWLRVILVNTDFRLPQWCYDTFGGVLVLEKRSENPKHRQVLRWHCSCTKAEWILLGCLPFFLIKKEEAELGLAFQRTLGGPGRKVPVEIRFLREKYRNDLHAMKRFSPLFDPIVLDENGRAVIN